MLEPLNSRAIQLAAVASILTVLAAIGLFFLFFPGVETSKFVTRDYFFARLNTLAGPNAIQCGEIIIPRGGTADSSCAREALASAKPFWVAFTFRGYERFWFAFARGKDGKLWRLAFDPDRTGGSPSGPEPYLEVTLCPTVEIPARVGFPIYCKAALTIHSSRPPRSG